ncbi:LiaI-LiaF-like domain-containing protein [Bacteroidota bacterium]
MKTSSIFWGVFFIVFGIFLILFQLDCRIGDLSIFFDFWPLILVIWGISLLKIPDIGKKILAAISAILLALFLLACIYHPWCSYIDFDCDSDDDYSSSGKYHNEEYQRTIDYPYSSDIQFASLALDGGACEINIKETSKQLFEAYSYLPLRYFNFDSDKKDDKVDLKMKMKFGRHFLKKHNGNDVTLKMNPNPIWDLDFDIGAVDFDCDLTKFKVKTIMIDVGAADVDLKLGELYGETYIDIDAGASNVEINIPVNAGCRIDAKTGLSNKDFNGFNRIDDSWFTLDFENATQKIVINISGGISNFEVFRN